MWQVIAVIIIGILVVVYLVRKIYLFFTKPKNNNPCDGCTGCALKEDWQKKAYKDVTGLD